MNDQKRRKQSGIRKLKTKSWIAEMKGMGMREGRKIGNISRTPTLIRNSENTIYLLGSFNNWLPIQMRQIPEEPNIFEFMDFIKPGIHYFYLIKDGKSFCVNY